MNAQLIKLTLRVLSLVRQGASEPEIVAALQDMLQVLGHTPNRETWRIE